MTSIVNPVEAYILSKSPEARRRLTELRRLLRESAPGATEALKWGKPAAFIRDGILFQYAALKNHISLHPTPSVIDALRDELRSYEISQNTIRFSLVNPVPKELVLQIARLRLFQKTEQGRAWTLDIKTGRALGHAVYRCHAKAYCHAAIFSEHHEA